MRDIRADRVFVEVHELQLANDQLCDLVYGMSARSQAPSRAARIKRLGRGRYKSLSCSAASSAPLISCILFSTYNIARCYERGAARDYRGANRPRIEVVVADAGSGPTDCADDSEDGPLPVVR